jgi:hypothetical protein
MSPRLLLGRWWPDCVTRSHEFRPEVGWLVAINHAVWEITAVEDVTLNVDDRANQASWEVHRPGVEWKRRPFKATTRLVGGVRPDWIADGENEGTIAVHCCDSITWNVYPAGRWPQCSCCGEPMPCRAAIVDARVQHDMDKLAALEAKMPGACWSCSEPITTRQRAVTYAGENLDMPGGPAVKFHTRQQCRHAAEKYEERWLKANPGQPRIVTYPYCRGTLITHNDGISECLNGHPDCRGHLTHDHCNLSACRLLDGGCHKGCDPAKSYARHSKRPPVRDPNLPQDGHPRGRGGNLLGLRGSDPNDMRPACPGTLIVHSDGTEECTAGGLDDCWDGTKYRHDRHRDCCDMTHGCPRCEVTS